MNLDDIQNGARVMLDANIFIYAAHSKSREAARLISRCATEAVRGAATTFVVAEFCHRMMMLEAQRKGFVSGGNPAKALGQNSSAISQLQDYYDRTLALVNSNLDIQPVEASDFLLALNLQRRWSLMTNDSLNLAVAERLGIKELVTADSNFDKVQGLIVYKPSDLLT